jgi:hypothetical protein
MLVRNRHLSNNCAKHFDSLCKAVTSSRTLWPEKMNVSKSEENIDMFFLLKQLLVGLEHWHVQYMHRWIRTINIHM